MNYYITNTLACKPFLELLTLGIAKKERSIPSVLFAKEKIVL